MHDPVVRSGNHALERCEELHSLYGEIASLAAHSELFFGIDLGPEQGVAFLHPVEFGPAYGIGRDYSSKTVRTDGIPALDHAYEVLRIEVPSGYRPLERVDEDGPVQGFAARAGIRITGNEVPDGSEGDEAEECGYDKYDEGCRDQGEAASAETAYPQLLVAFIVRDDETETSCPGIFILS